jgi:hypothetical protein
VWFILQFIARRIQKLPVTLLEIDTLGVVVMTCISYFFWLNKPKGAQVPYIVRWKGPNAPPCLDSEYVIVIDIPGRTCSDLSAFFFSKGHATLRIYQLLCYKVPLFGALTPEDFMVCAACTSGMVFGAIHCLAWNFQFPRHAQKILWRVASIGILFSLSVGLRFFQRLVENQWGRRPSINGQARLEFYGIRVYYIPARVSIIVLMFLSL